MARYIHKVSGARVEVRDDKVMDSSWEAHDGSEPTTGDEAATTAAKRRPGAARAAK